MKSELLRTCSAFGQYFGVEVGAQKVLGWEGHCHSEVGSREKCSLGVPELSAEGGSVCHPPTTRGEL